MKKIVRLTERDLTRIVKRVLIENQSSGTEECITKLKNDLLKVGIKNLPQNCMKLLGGEPNVQTVLDCSREVVNLGMEGMGPSISFVTCMSSKGVEIPKDF